MYERGSKSQWCQATKQILKFFPAQLVTMDETWIYHYEPLKKQQ
jgi:hypothetical protein